MRPILHKWVNISSDTVQHKSVCTGGTKKFVIFVIDTLKADQSKRSSHRLILLEMYFSIKKGNKNKNGKKNREDELEQVVPVPGGRFKMSSPLGVMSKSSGRMEGCRFT